MLTRHTGTGHVRMRIFVCGALYWLRAVLVQATARMRFALVVHVLTSTFESRNFRTCPENMVSQRTGTGHVRARTVVLRSLWYCVHAVVHTLPRNSLYHSLYSATNLQP